jgi:outer membrane lipoprotein-sorting protein
MKNRASFLLLLVFLAACKDKQPVVRINKSKLNSISPADSTASFTIINEGSRDLIIEKHTVNCPCTLLTLSDSTAILPGDSLVVPLKLELTSKKRDSLIVFINLKTNANPQLTAFYFKIP